MKPILFLTILSTTFFWSCDNGRLSTEKQAVGYIFSAQTNAHIEGSDLPIQVSPIEAKDYSFDVTNAFGGAVPHFQINPITFENGNFITLTDKYSTGLSSTLFLKKEGGQFKTSIKFKTTNHTPIEKVLVQTFQDGKLLETTTVSAEALLYGIDNFPRCFFHKTSTLSYKSSAAQADLASVGGGGVDKPSNPEFGDGNRLCNTFTYQPINQDMGKSERLSLHTNLLQGITFLSVSSFQP